MFQEIEKESFDSREQRILKTWKENKIFEKSVYERQDRPLFVFYDGPPFATGLPHYGHMLAGTIKDVVPRYKTMKGYCVPRRFGWDCHGLPVENEVEKAHDLAGAPSIEAFGIGRFNEECRSIVLRYSNEWVRSVERMGRWVDFNATWHTMDLSFMESTWWVFRQLFDQGLVYEGLKVMPFSAKLGTPLSNFEANENYKDVDDPSITIAFNLINDPKTSILAWTTTPWTLVSNLALMVNPEITYVKIHDRHQGKNFILAKERLTAYYADEGEYSILEEIKGDQLIGMRYQPLFDYFAERKEQGAFVVIGDNIVSIEDGTGVVHSAPAFGEADFFACQRAGIELVCPVDNNGKFTAEIPEYQGLFVKDADKAIIRRLKEKGLLFKQATLRHRYPFCWRSDTPLIYKAVTTWFIAVESIKDKLLRANQKINWMPSYLKEGRFGKWLEGARDWAISRNRYWGTPIPLWRAEDGEIHCMGSIGELEELSGKKITDLHRHFIDDLTFQKNGKIFKRIDPVFDCWFESGSMPFGQNHYPFENKELFEQTFPADFIAEGLDQTRGWFYTLTVLSAALFDQPAFKNVIVNGLILAENGAKMSKRLKNYPDPDLVISKYGADAVRLYMLDSAAAKADDLCFAERGVELILRQVLIPLWNAYSFFITYVRIYGWKVPTSFSKPEAVIDQWILSQLQKLISEVEEGMEAYDLSRAVSPMVGFVDQLTNWYIRRSRRRFWSDEDSSDRRQAFETLYQVLLAFAKVAAPFIPFIADAIYMNLKAEGDPLSVHLASFPQAESSLRNLALEQGMAAIQATVSLGHSLRKEHKIKVRQPLLTAHVITPDPQILQFLTQQKHLIAEELNVKEVELISDESRFVSLQVKPNFRVLGRKVGKKMKEVQQKIEQMDQSDLNRLREGENVSVNVDGEEIMLLPEDVDVVRTVREGTIAANQGAITVALDTQMTEELEIEGLAREVVNKVNTMRRDADFEVQDRIIIRLTSTERVLKCFELHGDYIKNEVLAVQVEFNGTVEGTPWDLNGEEVVMALQKV